MLRVCRARHPSRTATPIIVPVTPVPTGTCGQPPAQQQPTQPAVTDVTVYTELNFGGTPYILTAGDYNSADWQRTFPSRILSVQVPAGDQVLFYQSNLSTLTGPSLLVVGPSTGTQLVSIADLRRFPIDILSASVNSAVPENAKPTETITASVGPLPAITGVTVYTAPFYGGKGYTLSQGTYSSSVVSNSLGAGNSIQSARIPPNQKAVFYTGNLAGQTVSVPSTPTEVAIGQFSVPILSAIVGNVPPANNANISTGGTGGTGAHTNPVQPVTTSLSAGTIAGIVVAVVIVLLIIIIVPVIVLKNKKPTSPSPPAANPLIAGTGQWNTALMPGLPRAQPSQPAPMPMPPQGS